MTASITHVHDPVNTPCHSPNTVSDAAHQHNILRLDKQLIRNKHRIIEEATKHKGYSNNVINVLKSLVNCSNHEGISVASQQTLMTKANVSKRTYQRAMNILREDGIVEWKKNGWRQTNTITLLPLKTELRHKVVKMANEYNKSYISLKDRDLNIHYREYECISTNSEKNNKAPFSQAVAVKESVTVQSESILEPAWKVSRETLPEPLQEAVSKNFTGEQAEQVALTLKRLKTDLDTKLELVKEVGQRSKNIIINNIAGYIIWSYKEMGNRTKSKPKKTDGPTVNTYELKQEAWRMAQKRLNDMGEIDPRYKSTEYPNKLAFYDAQKAYDDALLTWASHFYADLLKQTLNPKTEERPIIKTWADQIYS